MEVREEIIGILFYPIWLFNISPILFHECKYCTFQPERTVHPIEGYLLSIFSFFRVTQHRFLHRSFVMRITHSFRYCHLEKNVCDADTKNNIPLTDTNSVVHVNNMQMFDNTSKQE